MISIILGFVIFWVLARKLQLPKSIVPAGALGLSVFILCVHLTLPSENNLRIALGGGLEPWALLFGVFVIIYFYREILKRLRSLSKKNIEEDLVKTFSEASFSDVELDLSLIHISEPCLLYTSPSPRD